MTLIIMVYKSSMLSSQYLGKRDCNKVYLLIIKQQQKLFQIQCEHANSYYPNNFIKNCAKLYIVFGSKIIAVKNIIDMIKVINTIAKNLPFDSLTLNNPIIDNTININISIIISNGADVLAPISINLLAGKSTSVMFSIRNSNYDGLYNFTLY